MNRTDSINKLIEWNGFKSYLEIGVENPWHNFNSIKIENKECVDINPNATPTYVMTSDEFFSMIPDDKKYDIIFIDAMHVEEYVDRDLTNSLKHLNPGGMICLHDVVPLGESFAQKKDKYDGSVWNGDVYRSVVKLAKTPLNYVTVRNDDHGLTVLYNNDNILEDISKYTCEYSYRDIYDDGTPEKFTELGKKLMHGISESEFVEKFSK